MQPQRPDQPQQQQQASLVQPPKIPAGTRWQPCSSPPRDRSELWLAPVRINKPIPAPQLDTPALLHPLGLRLAKLPGGLPQPGRLKRAEENWHQISSNAWIRETVRGYRIPFIETPPQCRNRGPPQNAMRSDLCQALDGELETLASSGAIDIAVDQPGFVSPLFLCPKPDGRWRVIFNLPQLNMHIQTTHFKMETIHHLKEVVWRGDFVARLHFTAIPVAAADRRWLQFQWRGKRWQYTCLPFGLADAPRTFTKVMAPIAAILRQAGVRLLRYLDDWLFAGQSEDTVRQAVAAAVYLMERLGFTVNYFKSALMPEQELLFLGFVINTALWTLGLPSDKLKKLQHECRRVLRKNGATSTELRSILGTMEAARPATTLARLNMQAFSFSSKPRKPTATMPR